MVSKLSLGELKDGLTIITELEATLVRLKIDRCVLVNYIRESNRLAPETVLFIYYLILGLLVLSLSPNFNGDNIFESKTWLLFMFWSSSWLKPASEYFLFFLDVRIIGFPYWIINKMDMYVSSMRSSGRNSESLGVLPFVGYCELVLSLIMERVKSAELLLTR